MCSREPTLWGTTSISQVVPSFGPPAPFLTPSRPGGRGGDTAAKDRRFPRAPRLARACRAARGIARPRARGPRAAATPGRARGSAARRRPGARPAANDTAPLRRPHPRGVRARDRPAHPREPGQSRATQGRRLARAYAVSEDGAINLRRIAYDVTRAVHRLERLDLDPRGRMASAGGSESPGSDCAGDWSPGVADSGGSLSCPIFITCSVYYKGHEGSTIPHFTNPQAATAVSARHGSSRPLHRSPGKRLGL